MRHAPQNSINHPESNKFNYLLPLATVLLGPLITRESIYCTDELRSLSKIIDGKYNKIKNKKNINKGKDILTSKEIFVINDDAPGKKREACHESIRVDPDQWNAFMGIARMPDMISRKQLMKPDPVH